MKIKTFIIGSMALYMFVGCINFHPVEVQQEEEDSVGMVNDPADDLVMQNSPHLKFKNVPIDGSLDKFVERMERSGFTVLRQSDDQATLSGDFADFKKCTVYVETLIGKDLVSTITVHFPEQNKWQALYYDYKHLKELLTTKYGKVSTCVEMFQTSYIKPKTDEEKIRAVYSDECKYETRFVTDKGEITLRIENESIYRTFVSLTYKDKINNNVIEDHALNDL